MGTRWFTCFCRISSILFLREKRQAKKLACPIWSYWKMRSPW